MNDAQKPAKATPLQVAKAVFWSFFSGLTRMAIAAFLPIRPATSLIAWSS